MKSKRDHKSLKIRHLPQIAKTKRRPSEQALYGNAVRKEPMP